MVRELNHRAKNILQVIASVLVLEKNRANSEETRAALDRASGRLQMMAQVHAMLYLTGDETERVDMRSYLTGLCRAVTDGLCPAVAKVEFDIGCDQLRWPVETAGQLGLIVTEVLTNTCKHAFETGEDALIKVQLHKQDDDRFCLEISDNGKGFDGASTKGGVGTALLQAFAQTLKAELKVESKPGDGTRVLVSLPKESTEPDINAMPGGT